MRGCVGWSALLFFANADNDENFAFTPATKKKIVSVQTPKSILKRKCEKQGLSTTKKKGKKIHVRLSLTKTRNRKSLLNAFTESR